jgi:hypothetical protein
VPPPWKSIPGTALPTPTPLNGKSDSEIRKGKFKAVGATDSGPCRQPILHDGQVLLTVNVEVLGIVDLVFLDDAGGLEETILGVLVVRLITGVREHCFGKVTDREVTTCRGKKKVIVAAQTEDKKRQMRWRQRYGKRRTDVNLVSHKRRPINLLFVQLD